MTSLNEWMAQAQVALAQGDHEKARTDYRAAAQHFPEEKLPWLKLSEDYFNAHDYGHAVLAAQEALQRDPHDELAHSLLAVSGLRITAGSLKALRPDERYAVGSREEALAVTRSLREALGETALLPPPGPAGTSTRAARKPRAAAPGSADVPTTAAPAASPGNPLDKLK